MSLTGNGRLVFNSIWTRGSRLAPINLTALWMVTISFPCLVSSSASPCFRSSFFFEGRATRVTVNERVAGAATGSPAWIVTVEGTEIIAGDGPYMGWSNDDKGYCTTPAMKPERYFE